mmetsp:Transcript_26764/g.51913  ORF Transcript_26764/g.51913 Transcript_26764/m.51913 type:complete len:313 (+) Transcript_26764:1-939(+)
MGYEEGVPLNDEGAMRAARVYTVHVAERISRLFCQMLFVDGFVHCDPHPGNLLVTWDKTGENGKGGGLFTSWREPRVVVLDHALYRELSPGFRENLKDLWMGVLFGEENKMIRSARMMLAGCREPSESRLASTVPLSRAKLLIEIITRVPYDILTNKNISLPRRLDLLEGKATFPNSSPEAAWIDKMMRSGGRLSEVMPRIGTNDERRERMWEDLFFTLKTLECLRACKRGIGVLENLTLSGARVAIARDAINKSVLVKCVASFDKRWPIFGFVWRWISGGADWHKWVHDTSLQLISIPALSRLLLTYNTKA